MAGAVMHLPATLLDPKMTGATSATQTAFQRAYNLKTTRSFWDVIENGDQSDPGTAELREIFPLSMIGQGQMNSAVLIADFPWASLGDATIVDVGGGPGVGSMCLELADVFPNLRFVVEDLQVHIKEAEAVWDDEIPGAVESGRVQLTVHDSFTVQPVKGAAVYMLRHVL
ncbi:hypothetical protein FOMPIDRAFT_1050032 [Fomitopsis schrenkii]|uniref:O-methyltransferase domain-containing protein n=1 Tax=Fomitopsis schrenkii TaxID=2126942 RepID=S8EAC7_FOMSC|nr:hypothetical protein FOMPIDRAFT_1050032 [Fomitopsis schrenkii]